MISDSGLLSWATLYVNAVLRSWCRSRLVNIRNNSSASVHAVLVTSVRVNSDLPFSLSRCEYRPRSSVFWSRFAVSNDSTRRKFPTVRPKRRHSLTLQIFNSSFPQILSHFIQHFRVALQTLLLRIAS